MSNRRDFIKQSCGLCIGLVGLGALASQLSACSPLPIFKAEIEKDFLSVPVSSFSEKNNMVIVRNSKMPYDILLIKLANGNYNALEMKCSHQDNALTATKTGLFCASHGSTFDLNGEVTKEPAMASLKKYRTETASSVIQILLKS